MNRIFEKQRAQLLARIARAADMENATETLLEIAALDKITLDDKEAIDILERTIVAVIGIQRRTIDNFLAEKANRLEAERVRRKSQ